MRTLQLGLTADQIAARRNGIGGSDATILMSGDDDRIHRLWLEKLGEAEGEDLSRVLPVQMGSFTEPLNLYWYTLMTGRAVTAQGESRQHADYPWMRCTLDGLTATAAGALAVMQAKHVNAFAKIDEVTQKYMPQVHHEMAVCRAGFAVLSVFVGTLTYEFVEIARDDWYLAELIDRERAFWRCVETRTEPPRMAPVAAPVPPAKFREIDLDAIEAAGEALPNWGYDIRTELASWAETAAGAKRNAEAAKEIKKLLPDDVGLLTTAAALVKRAKNGAVSIKEVE